MDINDDKTFQQLYEIWGRLAKKLTKNVPPTNLNVNFDSIMTDHLKKILPGAIDDGEDFALVVKDRLIPAMKRYAAEIQEEYGNLGDDDENIGDEYYEKVENISRQLIIQINKEDKDLTGVRETMSLLDVMISIGHRMEEMLGY